MTGSYREFSIKKIAEYNGPKVKVTTPCLASDFIRPMFSEIEAFEEFFIILLDIVNNVIGYVKTSQGGASGTVVDMKILANVIATSLASSIITAHNHPSGSTHPSDSDKGQSKRIKELCQVLDVTLLDNLIITKTNYNTF